MFQLTQLPPLSLYVHIPWCLKKCPYCDFNSHAMRDEIDETGYVNALLADLQQEMTAVQGRQIQSIFIGGGTPSLFSPQSISRLLQGIYSQCRMQPDAEITMEANPGTFEQQKFFAFRSAGINRLSIGIQSFNDTMLTALGRVHDGATARQSVELARKAGFDNMNLDLMFGLPGQTVDQGRHDIQTAAELQPEHISYYQLTLEPNTLFHARPPQLPDDGRIWLMQQLGQQILAENGYNQYEVSAYAVNDRHCRHNMNYWQFGDYIGIGAGAHGKLTDLKNHVIRRRKKYRQPKQFVQACKTGAQEGREQVLTEADAVLEFMMNAMRLIDGVPTTLFEERTGLTVDSLQTGMTLARQKGLLSMDNNLIQPTPLGQRYLNDLLEGFLAEGSESPLNHA